MVAPQGSSTIKYGNWNERARVYIFDGVTYPSVTSVIGMMDKPALINWAARLAAEYSQDNRAALGQLDPEAAVDAIKGAWRRSRDRAANFGTAVHEMIESRETPEPDSELAPYVDGAAAFLKGFKLDVTSQEVTVVSKEHGYAGTMDVLALRPKDDAVVVVDWKSGKGLYDSAALQLSALMNADHIVRNNQLVPFNGAHLGVAVRLTQQGKYYIEVLHRTTKVEERTYKAFIGLIDVWHYKTKAEVWE